MQGMLDSVEDGVLLRDDVVAALLEARETGEPPLPQDPLVARGRTLGAITSIGRSVPRSTM